MNIDQTDIQEIYVDNAATTIHKPGSVGLAMMNAIHSLGNSGRGSYPMSIDATRMVYETRCMVSELFQGDSPEQVVFTANATHGLNMVIKGILGPGDHVITTEMEHNSVLRPIYEMEALGVKVTILPCDSRGRISLLELQQAIRVNTKAVICTHASNVTGNVNPLSEIGRICRESGLLFIVDVAQTAGCRTISMREMGIDILCFTGHKGLMGPQGTGGICLKKGIELRPLYTGGSGFHSFTKQHPGQLPEALEAGTLNMHGLAGLHAALLFLKETGIEEVMQKEHEISMSFYHQVKDMEGLKLYGDFHSERVGIVSLNIDDVDSSRVSDELSNQFKIYTRAGAHCAPLMHQRFGTEKQGMVRFSFGFFNHAIEVQRMVQAILKLRQ